MKRALTLLLAAALLFSLAACGKKSAKLNLEEMPAEAAYTIVPRETANENETPAPEAEPEPEPEPAANGESGTAEPEPEPAEQPVEEEISGELTVVQLPAANITLQPSGDGKVLPPEEFLGTWFENGDTNGTILEIEPDLWRMTDRTGDYWIEGTYAESEDGLCLVSEGIIYAVIVSEEPEVLQVTMVDGEFSGMLDVVIFLPEETE